MTRMGIFKRKGKKGWAWYGQWWVKGRRVTRSLGPKVKTEAQAQKVWDEVEHQRIMGKLGLLDSSPATLGQLRAQFLEAKAPHLSHASQRRYDVSLRMLAHTFGDGCLLRSLTARKLSAWAGQRRDEGVSPSGVNCDLRHIRAALNWAAGQEMIERAPLVAMVKAPKALPRHMLPEQVEALLAASPLEQRRLWTFLVWTGCRREEFHGLRWEHITWEPHPAARVVGKGDKERLVPLLPAAAGALLGIEAAGEFRPWPPARRIGLIWPEVTPNVLSKWFKAAARRAGLGHARLHDTRHTAITWMLSRGVPVRLVMEIAGHANISTTMGYGKALVADLYEELAKSLPGN